VDAGRDAVLRGAVDAAGAFFGSVWPDADGTLTGALHFGHGSVAPARSGWTRRLTLHDGHEMWITGELLW
jgi:hypothetical protein